MKNQEGQSLFEIVLSMAIITAIIVGLISLVVSAIRNATFSRNETQAARYAQETTEWLRQERDNDFDLFKEHLPVSNKWCFSELTWSKARSCSDNDEITGTPLKREATFSSSVQGGKTIIEVEVKVSWDDSQGEHQVKTVTSFSDWRER